mmetsp:Transcript_81581/g.162336  ORF Transcript_81581/g.162336 Transcript_81581/m.162336 type:complete len:265 (+) Transcript_81581:264-1058(+)
MPGIDGRAPTSAVHDLLEARKHDCAHVRAEGGQVSKGSLNNGEKAIAVLEKEALCFRGIEVAEGAPDVLLSNLYRNDPFGVRRLRRTHALSRLPRGSREFTRPSSSKVHEREELHDAPQPCVVAYTLCGSLYQPVREAHGSSQGRLANKLATRRCCLDLCRLCPAIQSPADALAMSCATYARPEASCGHRRATSVRQSHGSYREELRGSCGRSQCLGCLSSPPQSAHRQAIRGTAPGPLPGPSQLSGRQSGLQAPQTLVGRRAI